jgi:spore maturation protein CgeB
MHILYLDWPCFGQVSILSLFEQRGYKVTKFAHPDYLQHTSDAFMQAAEQLFLQQETDFDLCFSYNYFPLMARVCHAHNLKYVSFVYDSPQVKLYSYTVTYPTNYIFVFDSELVRQFRSNGLNTFYYMPLPVNGTIIDQLLKKKYDRDRLSAQVSFVGSLYDEEHNFLDRYTGISEYTKGYLNAIMEAQSKVYGYSFLEECLTPPIIDDLQSQVGYSPDVDGVETPAYVFADYFLCRKLTAMERRSLLTSVAASYPLKLFTLNKNASIPHAQNMGTADYDEEMPYIFHNSQINLNISLRSIKSGIPLRCMDIMGCGGFLLSNYQADFLLHFTPDEDFVYFENEADLLHKIDYYLSHEEKRAAIAAAGHDKVLKHHSFDVIFDEILSIVQA